MSSFGNSVEEAKGALSEAIELFVEECECGGRGEALRRPQGVLRLCEGEVQGPGAQLLSALSAGQCDKPQIRLRRTQSSCYLASSEGAVCL